MGERQHSDIQQEHLRQVDSSEPLELTEARPRERYGAQAELSNKQEQ